MYSSSPGDLQSAVSSVQVTILHLPTPSPKRLRSLACELVSNFDEMCVNLPLLGFAFSNVLETNTLARGGSASMEVEDELLGELCDGTGGDDQAFSSFVLYVS